MKRLHIKPSMKFELKRTLNELTRQKKIIKDRKYYKMLPRSENSYSTGEIDFGKDGRMVVRVPASKGGGIYKISDVKTFKPSIGDTVEFSLNRTAGKDGKKSAKVIRIIDGGKKFVTGRFENYRTHGIVIPDSKDIRKEVFISPEMFNKASDGDKVVFEILNPEEMHDEFADLRGKITEILGKTGDRAAEEKSIMRKFNLVKAFPKDVMNEAEETEIERTLKGRTDLRKRNIFTIDPIDAKDFDDAVSLEINDDGTYLLGVHIADVSHYVKENSALDKEAQKRGTSAYLVRNVIPMLPEKLSNDICSLKPDEDRLTFSIFMILSKRGVLKSFEINKSIIRSKRRFTYEEAQKIIQTGEGDFSEELGKMYKLSKTITMKRLKEESLDFDSNEVKFMFDKKGNVKDIVVKERLDSMRLIEEFMLLANKCATLFVKDLAKKNEMFYPFIYRVHDIPNRDKVKELSEFIKQFGYSINIEDKNSLRKLLTEIEGKPEEFIINDLLIRTMAKAIYTTKNIGHYGLGFRDYTHFTSPIRRYPDLIVHRILFDYIRQGKEINKRVEYYKKVLPDICKQSSVMEQNAEIAERESIKLLQVDFISKHVGDEFEGIISGIVQFGMFVEIMDILVEGMIRFRDIDDDYYEYDERNHLAKGRRRGKTYRAGQKVRVRVIRVNKENRKIDFVLV